MDKFDATVVHTAEGLISGLSTLKLNVYKGIRYGEDTATSRFSPPVPVQPWDGIRQAAELGSQCIQRNPDSPPWLDASDGMSEDCLFLNVWSPRNATGLPVMVWIHGGAYEWGSGGAPMYDGAALADRGEVVVVTVNHRLNIFGYLYFGGIAEQFRDSANLGQLDLIEALRWIQRNIAAFGGDPENVTIFGESGGGAKISVLLGMPAAQGLFAKAILQSGAQLKVRNADEDNEIARAVLSNLGLRLDDIDRLRSVDAHQLFGAYEAAVANSSYLVADFVLPISPILDPKTVPYQLDSDDAQNLWVDVPIMLGITEEETAYFVLDDGRVPEPADDGALLATMRQLFADLTDADTRELVSAYRQVATTTDRSRLLVAATSGHWLWGAVERQATLKAMNAAAAPVYVYIFGWKDPFGGSTWAVHGEEVGFVFDNFEVNEYLEFGVDSATLRAAEDPAGARYTLRDATMDAWLSFAREGSPSSSVLPHWPNYATDRRPVMRLDGQPQVWNDPWGPGVRAALGSRSACGNLDGDEIT